MTDWQVTFLGVMAVALVAMAAAQVLVALTMLRTARQVTDAMQNLQRDLRPIIEKANRATDDAVRVTSLAVLQVERVDRLLATVSGRVDETLGVVQGAIVGPVRQGAAIIAAIRGVMSAVRDRQRRSGAPREDEDPLFVG